MLLVIQRVWRLQLLYILLKLETPEPLDLSHIEDLRGGETLLQFVTPWRGVFERWHHVPTICYRFLGSVSCSDPHPVEFSCLETYKNKKTSHIFDQLRVEEEEPNETVSLEQKHQRRTHVSVDKITETLRNSSKNHEDYDFKLYVTRWWFILTGSTVSGHNEFLTRRSRPSSLQICCSADPDDASSPRTTAVSLQRTFKDKLWE